MKKNSDSREFESDCFPTATEELFDLSMIYKLLEDHKRVVIRSVDGSKRLLHAKVEQLLVDSSGTMKISGHGLYTRTGRKKDPEDCAFVVRVNRQTHEATVIPLL